MTRPTEITFTLPDKFYEVVPQELAMQWAEALQTSKKRRHQMSNREDTKHCCLCVLARLEGASHKDYSGYVMPQEEWAPVARAAVRVNIQADVEIYHDDRVGDNRLSPVFSYLNDVVYAVVDGHKIKIELTHKEIGQLVRDGSYTWPVPAETDED